MNYAKGASEAVHYLHNLGHFAMMTYLFGNLAAILLNRHRLKTAGGLLLFGLIPAIGIAADLYILVQSFFIETWAQDWASGKSVVVFDVACTVVALGLALRARAGTASGAASVAAS